MTQMQVFANWHRFEFGNSLRWYKCDLKGIDATIRDLASLSALVASLNSLRDSYWCVLHRCAERRDTLLSCACGDAACQFWLFEATDEFVTPPTSAQSANANAQTPPNVAATDNDTAAAATTSPSISSSLFGKTNAVQCEPLLNEICHVLEQGVLSNSERVADACPLRFDVVGAWHLALRYHLTRMLVDEHGFSYDARRDLVVLPSASANDALYVTPLVLDASAARGAWKFGASLEFVQCSRSTFVVVALYQLSPNAATTTSAVLSSSSSLSLTAAAAAAPSVDETVLQHLPLDDYLEGEFLRLAGLVAETTLCPPILNFCDVVTDDERRLLQSSSSSLQQLQKQRPQSPLRSQTTSQTIRIQNRFVPSSGAIRSSRFEKSIGNELPDQLDIVRYT